MTTGTECKKCGAPTAGLFNLETGHHFHACGYINKDEDMTQDQIERFIELKRRRETC